MLFHEMYGLYYQVMSKIIQAALEERLTPAELRRIATEETFAETVLTVEPALKSGRWPLVDGEGFTPLMSAPERPLSLLEKRWLKTISMDPRLRLFGDLNFDEAVEPLFRPEDVVVYDRFGDGDPYGSPEYRDFFQLLLMALREQQTVKIVYLTQRGIERTMLCVPSRMEYSAKDDKFRIIVWGEEGWSKINLGRIQSAVVCGKSNREQIAPVRKRNEYVLELTDERNALERAMLHFADLEKRTERMEGNRYRMTLICDADDKTELVIRVLSFGPMLRAVEPEDFVDQIRKRLNKQSLLNW